MEDDIREELEPCDNRQIVVDLGYRDGQGLDTPHIRAQRSCQISTNLTIKA